MAAPAADGVEWVVRPPGPESDRVMRDLTRVLAEALEARPERDAA